MKRCKNFLVSATVLILLYSAPSSAQSDGEASSLKFLERSLDLADALQEHFRREESGNWLNDFRWIGFSEWSFESNAQASGGFFTNERVLLLLRIPRGKVQPYLGMVTGLSTSEDGVAFDPGSKGMMLGLFWNF